MTRQTDFATHLAAAILAGACTTTDPEVIEQLQRKGDTLCQSTDDCLGADHAWVQACTQELDRQITAGAEYDCLDVMDAWLTCLDASSTRTTDGNYTDAGACREQEALAEDCRNGRV